MSVYLGIDVSTQGVKGIVIESATGEIVASESVNFGIDLPEYGSPNGFLPSEKPLVYHANPVMWIAGIEKVLQRLQTSGAPMSRIGGVSGSAQQHATVYVAHFPERWDESCSLTSQVAVCLSRKTSPIWMDRSTSEECDELTQKFGGKYLAQVTGSVAVERFSAAQIRRFFKGEPNKYAQTERIHLASSFCASVLCCGDAGIDNADGSGMNLMDVRTRQWVESLCNFCAPGLVSKLPRTIPGGTVVGGLSSYFKKYGLTEGVPVIAWTGDNPSSLVGMGGTENGTVIISLGTSDTVCVSAKEFMEPEAYGHLMVNPNDQGYFGMVCFSNGALAREHIKEECRVDWDFFDQGARKMSFPGNEGRLMLPYFVPECTPLVLHNRVCYNFDMKKSTKAERIRALLESQALSFRLHTSWLKECARLIRVTGGASGSPLFKQILADVFQAPVESTKVKNSTALGAALRVVRVVENVSLESLYERFSSATDVVFPTSGNAGIYEDMLAEYAEFEAKNVIGI